MLGLNIITRIGADICFCFIRKMPKELSKQEVCFLFMLDEERNPRTRRRISPQGRVAKKLKKECRGASLPRGSSVSIRELMEVPTAKRRPSRVDCDKWFENPRRNPETGRAIKANGPTFRRLEKECGKNWNVGACLLCGAECNPQSQVCGMC